MSIQQKLKWLIDAGKPWAALITMYSSIIIAGSAIWKWAINPRDLAVYVQKQDLSFPWRVNEQFTRVYNYIVDSGRNLSLSSDAKAAVEYLQNTDKFWVVTLHNQTNNSIRGINVRFTGVTQLTFCEVNGDFLTDSEKVAYTQRVQFEKDSKIVKLSKIDLLQPKSEMKIYLWGKMDDLSLWSNLFVNYEGGDARAGEEITVRGFKALLCEYLYEILFLLCLLFGFVYWTKIRKPANVST